MAEDLTADVFERALRGWPHFRRRSQASTWVVGIARHVVADYWRQAGRRPLSLDALGTVPPIPGASPEEVVEAQESLRLLRQAVLGLSAEEQDLLALRYSAGLSFRAIGQVLEVNEGTVRVRLHRIKARLRALLGEEAGD